MNRKAYILVLLFLSWIIANAHRAWNNTPIQVINPIPFERDYEITIHWYAHFILKDISYILIFLSILLYITSHLKRDKDVLVCFGAVFVVQMTDLIHYILFARHNEYVLFFQGLIMLSAALIILLKKSQKISKWIGY